MKFVVFGKVEKGCYIWEVGFRLFQMVRMVRLASEIEFATAFLCDTVRTENRGELLDVVVKRAPPSLFARNGKFRQARPKGRE